MDIRHPVTTTIIEGVNLTRERAAAKAKPARHYCGLAAIVVFVAILAAARACDLAQGVPV